MKTADSVQQLITGTSTAVMNLGAATSGYRTLAAAIAAPGSVLTVGLTDVAFRADDDAGNWLNGRCTLTSAGQVTRTSIKSSSADGADVTLAGSGRKFSLTIGADDLNDFGKISEGLSILDLTAATTLANSDYTVWNVGGVDKKVSGALLKTFVGAASTPDTIAPTAAASAVANGSPTIVNITMSEAMDPAFVPAAAAFTVGGHTVSAVAISGAAINLTLSAPFVNGEAARTLAYAQPGTNNARDMSGNLLANFSRGIVNNVGDVTAPGFTSAQVLDSSPTVIAVTMNEALKTSTVPVPGAFLVSGGKTVTNVSIAGAVISLTCSAAYVSGDTITVQYVKPGSGNTLQDANGNATASFGPSGVTNNVQAVVTGPAYRFNGPVFGAVPTTLSYGGNDFSQSFSGDFQIRTAEGLFPDDTLVDLIGVLSTSATVLARQTDTDHLNKNNSVMALGRIGAGNDAYGGDYGIGSLYTYAVGSNKFLPRYFQVQIYTKGADKNTATPIWWGVYDGNHTGTPQQITMTA